MKKMNRDESILVVIDIQERLAPAMKDDGAMVEASSILIKGCRTLGVPVIVTQQYTKGLGATVDEIQSAYTEALEENIPAQDFQFVEKTSFSAMGEPEFEKQIKAAGKKTVLICGIEAHVCVMQTAMDLAEAGHDVFLVTDCIGSRKKSDKKTSIARMTQAGIVPVTYEIALFELLKGARETGFKQISKLVK